MQKINNILVMPLRLISLLLIMLGFGLARVCMWVAK